MGTPVAAGRSRIKANLGGVVELLRPVMQGELRVTAIFSSGGALSPNAPGKGPLRD